MGNFIEIQYLHLLEDILEQGSRKDDRTGTGTLSVFGKQIRHKMSDGFPLLTTKKMYFKGIVTELIWFLRGDTNIKFLIENGCHIWTGDAYKKYRNAMNNHYVSGGDIADEKVFEDMIIKDSEFCQKWGNLGPVYGKQWRCIKKPIHDEYGNYCAHTRIDQIANLINDLKENPDSRRMLVNSWNAAEIDEMTLPPCHYSFQCYTRNLSISERKNILYSLPNFDVMDVGIGKREDYDYNKIDSELCDSYNVPKKAVSLMWNQRSVDTFLGLPFNIASYGLLLEIIANEVNMVADELIGNLGDTHLYLNHIDQANEQLGRTPYKLPTLKLSKSIIKNIDDVNLDDFILDGYQSHLTIKAKLSN